MRILCTGISHKTADVSLRELVAFDAATRAAALGQLARRWPQAEFAILSTCNRVEIYTARPLHGHPREQQLVNWLERFHGLSAGELLDHTYVLADRQAAEHLFAVAAGLDSLVPGEAQIAAQVKDAYAAARQAGTAGATLNELFQRALRTAKHVRSETAVGTGKVSVASVAIDCIDKVFESARGKSVLSIGAGKMNELMLMHLRRLGAGRIAVANRSADRAERLAQRCGGEAVAFERIAEELLAADIVLSSTGAPAAIITRAMVESALSRRNGGDLLIVDLAVPRDVEPTVGQLEGVHLYDIDDLEEVVAANVASRSADIAAARRIVERHVDELMQKLNVRDVVPTIDELYRRMERICDEELAAAGNKLSTHDDAQADMEVLRQTIRRAMRRFIHPCVRHLRDSAGSDAARAHVSLLRKLFDLEDRGEP